MWTLTVLLHAELSYCVDVSQELNTGLNFGAPFTSRFFNALNHLLLSVDPIQVIAKDSKSYRLQHIGVLKDNAISP